MRLAFVDAAYVGDPGAGLHLDLQAGDRLFPHPLQRTAERHPHAALGAGHQGNLLCRSGDRDKEKGCKQSCQEGRFQFHAHLLSQMGGYDGSDTNCLKTRLWGIATTATVACQA